jgi:hypothetical protein
VSNSINDYEVYTSNFIVTDEIMRYEDYRALGISDSNIKAFSALYSKESISIEDKFKVSWGDREYFATIGSNNPINFLFTPEEY